jgi:NADH-quinone oxidoreductase subunit H
VTLFFGGWTLAMFGYGITTAVLQSWGILGMILGVLIFFTKMMFFMVFYVWIRGTFPRFRFDQLMELGWKWMIPLALINLAVTGVIVLALHSGGI